MANLVLLYDAAKESDYTQEHITWLLRQKKIEGRKVGLVWMVDLDSLKAYEAKMKEIGTKKHDPTKNRPKS